MGYTTSYWQKERWSRRVADMLTSYELWWNASGENEFGTCLDPDLAGVGFLSSIVGRELSAYRSVWSGPERSRFRRVTGRSNSLKPSLTLVRIATRFSRVRAKPRTESSAR